MAGLLASVLGPECPNGHGRMPPLDGIYGLPQFVPSGLMGGGGIVTGGQTQVISTGRIFTVKIFACETCGTVLLMDAAKVPA